MMAQGRPLPQLRDVEGSVQAGFQIEGTIAWIRLPTPLAPGSSADFEFSWGYTVPADGAPRSGTDGEVFMIAYWYPQVAVYDDVNGWQTDWYMGNAEFYMGYADYDVALTVPAGWLIGSTGELKNAAEVSDARDARATRPGAPQLRASCMSWRRTIVAPVDRRRWARAGR